MSEGRICKHCRQYDGAHHNDARCSNGKFELLEFDVPEKLAEFFKEMELREENARRQRIGLKLQTDRNIFVSRAMANK